MKTERDMWKKIKSIVDSHPHVYAERIENSVNAGTPDVYLMINNVPIWIENKVVSTLSSRIGIRASQIGWHKKYVKGADRMVYVLVYCNHTSLYYLFEMKEIFNIPKPGYTLSEIMQYNLTIKGLGVKDVVKNIMSRCGPLCELTS